jgi:hypothetical protein
MIDARVAGSGTGFGIVAGEGRDPSGGGVALSHAASPRCNSTLNAPACTGVPFKAQLRNFS